MKCDDTIEREEETERERRSLLGIDWRSSVHRASDSGHGEIGYTRTNALQCTLPPFIVASHGWKHFSLSPPTSATTLRTVLCVLSRSFSTSKLAWSLKHPPPLAKEDTRAHI